MAVKGIITQGRKNGANVQYVTSFDVLTSSDGIVWDGPERMDNPNDMENSKIVNRLSQIKSTRYVRIQPVTWEGHPTIRVAVLVGQMACIGTGR